MKFLTISITCVAFLIQTIQANESLLLQDFVSKIPLWEVYPDSPKEVIGDNGKAYGHYQITSIMVKDYNRITGKKVLHEDCFDPEVSKEIAYEVLTHYSKHIKRFGVRPTVKHWLFIWNGGGGAWRRVHNPINDNKQLRLEAYANKAMTFL